jgi:hypothetical protein
MIGKNKPTETKKSRKEKTPRVIIDVSMFPKDEKGHTVVPDDFMDANYRNLPDGTVNESRTYRTYRGGKMRSLGGDPERDREIQIKGANTLNANIAQRKTMSETIDLLLRSKASRKDIETLGLDPNVSMTKQEAIVASIYLQTMKGNVKAATFIRDTVGEMPTTKQQITADITTEADRALIEKISKRLTEN